MRNKEYRADSTIGLMKYYIRIFIIPILLKAIAVLFALISIVVGSSLVFGNF